MALAVSVVAGLSSCLGDTKSSITASGYALITEDLGGRKIANVPTLDGGYQMRSGVIDATLREGDCAYISTYKIYLDDRDSKGIYNADQIVIEESKIMPNETQPRLVASVAPAVSATDTLVAFSSLRLSGMMFVASDEWGDRWIVPFATPLTENQEVTLQFYYDKNKQTDKDDKPLEEKDNIVVVDVRMTKTAAGTGSTTLRENVTAAKFAELRRQVIDVIEPGKEDIVKQIYFRYYMVEKVQNVSKTVLKYERAGVMLRAGKPTEGGGAV